MATLALVTAVLGSGLVHPAAARAADGDTVFSADPASESGRDGRQRFTYALDPGQHVVDHVEVRNQGTAPLSLLVYVTDAYNTPDGAFALLTSDTAPSGLGTWTDLGTSCDPAADPACTVPSSAVVTLEPGASAVVPFTVTVPADARPGDHAGGLVVSVASADGQVAVEHRVITRMYVRVAGALQPLVSVGGVSAALSGGLGLTGHSLDVTYTLTNTGNVALRGRVDVSVDGPVGNAIATAETVETAELLPGENRTATTRLEGVSLQGLLTAHVVLQPFVDEGAADPGELATARRTATVAAVPALAVALLALLVGALWWNRRWRRATRAQRDAEIQAALRAGRDQALALVAAGASTAGPSTAGPSTAGASTAGPSTVSAPPAATVTAGTVAARTSAADSSAASGGVDTARAAGTRDAEAPRSGDRADGPEALASAALSGRAEASGAGEGRS